jgi:hypothetical protein
MLSHSLLHSQYRELMASLSLQRVAWLTDVCLWSPTTLQDSKQITS